MRDQTAQRHAEVEEILHRYGLDSMSVSACADDIVRAERRLTADLQRSGISDAQLDRFERIARDAVMRPMQAGSHWVLRAGTTVLDLVAEIRALRAELAEARRQEVRRAG